MTQAMRRTLAPIAVTAAITLLGYLFVLTARGAVLEHRVTVSEDQQQVILTKLDELLELHWQTREALVRLEAKHEGQR